MSCEIWTRKYMVFSEVFFVSELNSEMWKTGGETWVKIFLRSWVFFLSLFSQTNTTNFWNCQQLWAEEFNIVWQILATPLYITLARPLPLHCHLSPWSLSIAPYLWLPTDLQLAVTFPQLKEGGWWIWTLKLEKAVFGSIKLPAQNNSQPNRNLKFTS